MTLSIALFNGRCQDLPHVAQPRKADLILTDPPFGTTQNKWDACIPFDEMWAVINAIKTDERTPILLMGQSPFDKMLGASNIREFRYEWIWEKTQATGFLNAKKMPLKAHENVLLFCEDDIAHENILVFYKKLPGYHPQMTTGHKPVNSYTKHATDGSNYGKTKTGVSGGGSTERYPRSVIKMPSDKQKSAIHPTQKPVDLMRYFIRTYTQPGDTVADFTFGSASTAIACILEGRHFFGSELDAHYFNEAVTRLKDCIREHDVDAKIHIM
jgi:DNA modification methylase